MNTKKALATTLSIVTMMNSSIKTVDACDSAAILETSTEASIACPIAGPVIMGTAIVVVTGVTIYNHYKTTDVRIYTTLGHLPDYWRPNSIVDKVKPNGKTIQRRIYDSEGRPLKDIDMSNHGDAVHHPYMYDNEYIHVHDYDHSGRSRKSRMPARGISEREYKQYIKEIDKRKVERIRVESKGAYVQQTK